MNEPTLVYGVRRCLPDPALRSGDYVVVEGQTVRVLRCNALELDEITRLLARGDLESLGGAALPVGCEEFHLRLVR